MSLKQAEKISGEYTVSGLQILDKAIECFAQEKYKESAQNLSDAQKIFSANKNMTEVSICLSLLCVNKYLEGSEEYYKSLLLLEDAKFLAQSCGDKPAAAVNKFAFGYIYYSENKFNDALMYLTSAVNEMKNTALLIKTCQILAEIYIKMQDFKTAYTYIKKAKEQINSTTPAKLAENIEMLSNNIMQYTNQKNKESEIELKPALLIALSEIARAVNAQTNLESLLLIIAEQTKIVLNADRCTVFLYDKNKNELWSKVALGIQSEEIRFSADKGFAGYAVKTGQTIRIKDAYNDTRFNKDIDKITGYKTYNLLCMPMRNIKYEITGAFQVLNKKDGDFTESDEEILLAIGTNAGIAIENHILFNEQQKMLEEQKDLFQGFIDTLAASIDARDKITLGHSSRVKLYSELISNKLGLNKDLSEIISKAAMLHDIGKIGIKDAVLQKKGSLTKEEYEHIKEHVKITYDILCKTNINEAFSEITEIAASHHEKYDGTGYFRGLKGEEIPLGGRILAVSDVFDAITSVRHYRDRMPMKDALKIMIDGKNKHFDGKIVDAFFDLSCESVMDVLISEFDLELKPKDRKLLRNIKLKDFADILFKNKQTPEERKITDVFNSYYIRQKSEITD